jgi:hypothetical protein
MCYRAQKLTVHCSQCSMHGAKCASAGIQGELMKNKALSGVAALEKQRVCVGVGVGAACFCSLGSGSVCSLHSIIHEERGNLALAYDLYGAPSRLHALHADDYPRAVICNSLYGLLPGCVRECRRVRKLWPDPPPEREIEKREPTTTKCSTSGSFK